MNKMEHYPHHCGSNRQRSVVADTRRPNSYGSKLDIEPDGGKYLIIFLRIPVMKGYIYDWSLPRSDVVCFGGEDRRFGTNGSPHSPGS